MPPGKLASQAGHAFLDAFLKAQEERPEIAKEYTGDSHGTKVTLVAKSLDHLLLAQEAARHKGIPCALIIDSGHIMPPHFDGSPIVTALGLGPATRDEIKSITKRFQLCK